VPETSYDSAGISIVMSNRSATDPRLGSFFDGDFDAAVPIHFQRLEGDRFMGVFSERWSSGVRPTNPADPNLFATYTIDTKPSWAIFDAVNGNHYQIPAQEGLNPPTRIEGNDRTATAACSRTNTYLYLLQRFSGDQSSPSVPFSAVSHYQINTVSWQVNLLTEEKIPSVLVGGNVVGDRVVGGKTVLFDRGIHCGETFLSFVGADSTGVLYLARKNWGYVGRSPGAIYETSPFIEYQTDKGWTQDASKAVSLKAFDGTPLTSVGPVDLTEVRGKTYMSVVENDGQGNVSAQVYVSRGLYDSWRPEGTPYSLGVLGTTYLGGTLYFQPNLRATGNRDASSVPFNYATKVVSGENRAIKISWDIWPHRVMSADTSLEVIADASAGATRTRNGVIS
jgi:hypothetical protein